MGSGWAFACVGRMRCRAVATRYTILICILRNTFENTAVSLAALAACTYNTLPFAGAGPAEGIASRLARTVASTTARQRRLQRGVSFRPPPAPPWTRCFLSAADAEQQRSSKVAMAPPPLFVSILLWCTLLAAAYGQRAPIHIPTDGARWYVHCREAHPTTSLMTHRLGNDGNWSTATIRIGTPAQYAYVLISTTISETWVAGSAWCSDSASGYSCEERGNAVDTAASSTWEEFGQYSLGYRPELTDQRDQYSVKDMGYGDYGLDVLKFKTTGSNPGEYSFDRQIIGVINDTTHLVGMMGLNVASRSFINETTYPSLMSTLYDNGTIPSRSYGYTAGAYHRRLQNTPVPV